MVIVFRTPGSLTSNILESAKMFEDPEQISLSVQRYALVPARIANNANKLRFSGS